MKNVDITAFFKRYGPSVYRRALYLLGKPEDAEEATQEVFIRVLQHAEAFKPRSQVYTWLYRITTNYCLNQIRDAKRRRELWQTHAADPHDCLDTTPSAEGITWLRRLLSEADETSAQAAVCVFLDGMSHEETAEMLGVSRRTVGNHLQRFRTWAADYLHRHADQDPDRQVACPTPQPKG